MGNFSSTDKKQEPSLSNSINKIAAKYILTANFQDLQNLKDPNYCNKVAILTGDIINKHLTSKEIIYLKQKTHQGEVIDEMTKDDVVYLDKSKVPSLDVQSKLQKKRVCYGIAKYYIKVGHLFSSIVGAVNPEYSYIDENNIEKRVSFKDKDKIPEKMKKRVKKINLCNRRINALINNKNFQPDDENEEITIQPRFCDINVGKRMVPVNDTSQHQIKLDNLNNPNQKYKISENLYTLIDEPGIPELEALYYDVYDYDSGEYKTMSDDAKSKYLEDVKSFYKHFTGNQNVPENVKRFSHITLKDYHSSNGCKPGNVYTQAYKGTIKDELFKKYADHIKMMTKKANDNQKDFFKVIDQMFIFQINNETKEKDITLHPELNDKKLNELIEITRKTLIKLYTECEKDFEDGLKIFESIVESQVKDTLHNQVADLEKRILRSVENPSDVTGSNNNIDVPINKQGINPIDIPPSRITDRPVVEQQFRKHPVGEHLVGEKTSRTVAVKHGNASDIENRNNIEDTDIKNRKAKIEAIEERRKDRENKEDFRILNPTEAMETRQKESNKNYDEEDKKIIEKLKDTYKEHNVDSKPIEQGNKGDSFFMAMSVELNKDKNVIRQEVADYINDNFNDLENKGVIEGMFTKEDYIRYIKTEGNYIVGKLELEAASKLYERHINVSVQSEDKFVFENYNDNSNGNVIYMLRSEDSYVYYPVNINNDKLVNNIIELLKCESPEPVVAETAQGAVEGVNETALVEATGEEGAAPETQVVEETALVPFKSEESSLVPTSSEQSEDTTQQCREEFNCEKGTKWEQCYRRNALKYHQDKGDDKEKFYKLTNCNEKIKEQQEQQPEEQGAALRITEAAVEPEQEPTAETPEEQGAALGDEEQVVAAAATGDTAEPEPTAEPEQEPEPGEQVVEETATIPEPETQVVEETAANTAAKVITGATENILKAAAEPGEEGAEPATSPNLPENHRGRKLTDSEITELKKKHPALQNMPNEEIRGLEIDNDSVAADPSAVCVKNGNETLCSDGSSETLGFKDESYEDEQQDKEPDDQSKETISIIYDNNLIENDTFFIEETIPLSRNVGPAREIGVTGKKGEQQGTTDAKPLGGVTNRQNPLGIPDVPDDSNENVTAQLPTQDISRNDFITIEAPMDGTCFFYSIAYHFNNLNQDINDETKNTIINNDKDNDNGNCEKAKQIKQMLARYYRTYLKEPEQNLQIEEFKVEEFEGGGYWSGGNNFYVAIDTNNLIDNQYQKIPLISRDDRKDGVPLNKWIKELEEKDCKTTYWADNYDLITIAKILREKLAISLILYKGADKDKDTDTDTDTDTDADTDKDKNTYEGFYEHPYLPENKIQQGELNELYYNCDAIFIEFVGKDHYNPLDRNSEKKNCRKKDNYSVKIGEINFEQESTQETTQESTQAFGEDTVNKSELGSESDESGLESNKSDSDSDISVEEEGDEPTKDSLDAVRALFNKDNVKATDFTNIYKPDIFYNNNIDVKDKINHLSGIKKMLEEHVTAREKEHKEQMAEIEDDIEKKKQEAAFKQRIRQIELAHNKAVNITLEQVHRANELPDIEKHSNSGQKTIRTGWGGKTKKANKKSNKANKKSKKANKKSKKANKK